MPLSEHNQKVVENMDKGLSGIAISIAKDSMKRMNESNAKYLSLHNLILTLAVGIAGVIIPLLNEHAAPNAQPFLLIALIIFGIDVLFGVTALALGLSQEQLEIPISQETLLALVANLRTRLREARETALTIQCRGLFLIRLPLLSFLSPTLGKVEMRDAFPFRKYRGCRSNACSADRSDLALVLREDVAAS